MAKLRKLVTQTTYIWYEAELTKKQAARYKDGILRCNDDMQWEVIEAVEDEWEFVRDKPLSDEADYELIED
jgi:hypothetical protein